MKILSNKMALASITQDNGNTRVLFPQNLPLSHCKKTKKQKSPHCYANLRGTLNRYEHLIKGPFTLQRFNLTVIVHVMLDSGVEKYHFLLF